MFMLAHFLCRLMSRLSTRLARALISGRLLVSRTPAAALDLVTDDNIEVARIRRYSFFAFGMKDAMASPLNSCVHNYTESLGLRFACDQCLLSLKRVSS